MRCTTLVILAVLVGRGRSDGSPHAHRMPTRSRTPEEQRYVHARKLSIPQTQQQLPSLFGSPSLPVWNPFNLPTTLVPLSAFTPAPFPVLVNDLFPQHINNNNVRRKPPSRIEMEELPTMAPITLPTFPSILPSLSQLFGSKSQIRRKPSNDEEDDDRRDSEESESEEEDERGRGRIERGRGWRDDDRDVYRGREDPGGQGHRRRYSEDPREIRRHAMQGRYDRDEEEDNDDEEEEARVESGHRGNREGGRRRPDNGDGRGREAVPTLPSIVGRLNRVSRVSPRTDAPWIRGDRE